MATNSHETLKEAGHLNEEAGKHARHAIADLGHVVVETWGARVKGVQGTLQAGGEGLHAAGTAIHKTAKAVGAEAAREYKAAGHAVSEFGNGVNRTAHAAGAELAKENKEVVHAVSDFGNGVNRTVHAAGAELAREERQAVLVVSNIWDSIAHNTQAAVNRVADHYRDRPLTAAVEGPLGPVDGLIRGGIHSAPAARPADVHHR